MTKLDFTRFTEMTVPYKEIGYAYDVRVNAKTDENQIGELVRQKQEGVAMELPFLDAGWDTQDGRHGVEAEARYRGGDNPEIRVNVFPWKFDTLTPRQQQEVKNWALLRNSKKAVYRRYSTFEDQRFRVQELLKSGWSEKDIRTAFASVLSNARLTQIIQTASRGHHNEVVAEARRLKLKTPSLTLAEVVKAAGGDPTDKKLLNAVATKRVGGKREPIRSHKFAGKMVGTALTIQKEGQKLLDSYRDGNEGLAGIREKGYINKLKAFKQHQRNINNAFDEVVRRALAEMNVGAGVLDEAKAARAGR